MAWRDVLDLDDGTLEGNAAVFGVLLEQTQCSAGGEPATRAFWGQLAAHYAWMNHPGVHASGELEAAISGARVVAGEPPGRVGRGPEHVVHVLTQALQVGGHTRQVWRWIGADAGRRSSVVLTGQGWHPIPEALSHAATSSGGRILDLASRPGLLQDRATRLRKALATANTVVIHAHPFDVVPLLSLEGWQTRPPVLTVNHADHSFWIGLRSTDVVVSFREHGAKLAADRRGVAPERSKVVPLPVDPPQGRSPSTWRADNGLPADAFVTLSIASQYKYRPWGDLDFIDAIGSLVARMPNLHVLVVGPEPTGRWAQSELATGGRFRALGIRRDVADLLGAADVYLDSFPLSSLTSMLEAGNRGIPVMKLRSGPGLEILSGDSPGLDETVITFSTTNEMEQVLRALAEDAASRTSLGARTADAIHRVSSGAGWMHAVEEAYAAAAHMRATNAPPLVALAEPNYGSLDRRLAGLQLQGVGLRDAVRSHLRYLPVQDRSRLLFALRRDHPLSSAAAVVPDWARSRLRGFAETGTAERLAGR